MQPEAFDPLGTGLVTSEYGVNVGGQCRKEIVTMLTIRLCSADQMIFVAEASAGRRIVVTVLTKIERAPFGAPTPEEITHDQIAKQHFLKVLRWREMHSRFSTLFESKLA